ncbi:MAG: SLBB domain-containing protein, partial [Gammaproteobacteria bacterium]|nr:SLBB domain-containing protein [Gammaproteobacteria bacterium]
MRDIELKRKGKVVANFDLYDLLLNGDTSNDVRLLPGDVIFVKPLGKTVGIGGEVRRPAIYELGPQEKSVGDLLNYSGGMLPTAFPKVSQIERISENGQRTLVELDLSRKASLSEPILDGDTVRIFSILDRMNDIVMVSGHVRRPGGTEWRPGLRVQDVLKSMDELKSGADTDYGLIRREDAPNGHISVISVDLAEAIKDPFGPENVLLSPRDQLMVFSNNQSRAPVIKGLINELNLQARFNQPALVVRIAGNVRFPGNYPYVPDMRISDLVQASLDVLPETDMQYALVKREHPKENRIEVFSIALSDSLGSKGQNHDIKLQPSDEVTVFRLTQDRPPLIAGIVSKLRDNARFGQPEPVVSIIGNVRYPGNYPLESNMRLSDLIRASLDVLPATDMQYAILRRESNNRDHITLLPLSLYKAMSPVAEEDDPMLQPRDQLIVLSLKDNRSAIISQYIAELRQQARSGEPEPTVTIKGNAKHPGDYPLGPNMRVSDLVSASLGVLPATDMQYAIIRRESDNREEISLLPLSLSKAMNPAVEEDDPVLQPRDQLIVLSINDNRNELISQYINELRLQARYEQPEAVVSIMGNVRYPGDYPLGANMRVSDLISASLNLLPETDMQYALLERIEADDTTTILPVSLMAALSAPDSASNMALRMKDSLIVFNKTGDRQQAMGEILSDLKSQAILGQPARVVSINGRVKQAGSYPLTQGMRISDIVLASGGLTEAAYSMVAEITRFSVGQDSGFYTSHSTVNLGKAVAGDLSENKLLEPHDILTVKQAPDWLEQKSVSITGEVKFPGTYPITKGETLAQLLARAGGVTDLGEPVAAIFSRKALRSREAKAKDKLILDLEMDAALIQKDLASQATIDPQKMEK